MGIKRHALAFTAWKGTRYPLYRRLGGPQGQSGQVWKNPSPRSTGIRSPVARHSFVIIALLKYDYILVLRYSNFNNHTHTGYEIHSAFCKVGSRNPVSGLYAWSVKLTTHETMNVWNLISLSCVACSCVALVQVHSFFKDTGWHKSSTTLKTASIFLCSITRS